ncbi:MAG TPA: hypothetical protein DHS36_03695 [Candidatus Veblenbacteria bacterium]|nr:hypothetical protein [Candidatus Veblenbacteria bacterium]
MTKDYSVFLDHILASIEAIETYAQDISEQEFLRSPEKQDAILRRLEIIGEAVKNLPEEFKQQHPEVAWAKVMGTRNILVHEYFGVDMNIVWDTIRQSLPPLKKQIISLLESVKN